MFGSRLFDQRVMGLVAQGLGLGQHGRPASQPHDGIPVMRKVETRGLGPVERRLLSCHLQFYSDFFSFWEVRKIRMYHT